MKPNMIRIKNCTTKSRT